MCPLNEFCLSPMIEKLDVFCVNLPMSIVNMTVYYFLFFFKALLNYTRRYKKGEKFYCYRIQQTSFMTVDQFR